MSDQNTAASSNNTVATATSAQIDPVQSRHGIMQNYVLIWLELNIDTSKKDRQSIMTQLRNIVNDVYIYTNVDECVDFLTEIDDQKAFMIVSGELGEQLVPNIHEIPQLNAMYMYCSNQAQYEQWAQHWPKIKGVYTQITLICEDLQMALRQYDEDSIPISIVMVDENVSNMNLNQLEPSFMYTQIFKEILFEMEYDRQSINDFTAYCRTGDYGSATNIHRFETEYCSDLAIWWYTYPSFLFSMLNQALRTLESDTIMKLGFFICDLHRQIKELHQQQFSEHDDEEFVVYRGQALSLEHFEKLQKTKGGLLSFNNFLSTSKKRDVSLEYAEIALSKPDSIGILFEMTIIPSISSTPLAIIDKESYFRTEEEVLFSMHTVFRIVDIETINNNNRLYLVKLKLTADNDPQLQALIEHIRKDTFPDEKGWHRVGQLLITLGLFDKAEQVYSIALQQTTNEKQKGSIYYELGRIKANQGEYVKAISFYENSIEITEKVFPTNHPNLATINGAIGSVCSHMGQHAKALAFRRNALEMFEKTLPPNHPLLANSYHNIGLDYGNMGEYSKALSFSQKALAIIEKLFPPNHPSLTSSYNNIGVVYYHMMDYPKALSFCEKALEIRERTLPENHPSLATSYNNIAELYRETKQYSKAISFYEKTLEIYQKALPPNHPLSTTTYSNIGMVYYNMGEHAKGLSYCEKALEIQEKTLSENHPSLATLYSNIAELYGMTKQYSKALSFYEKTLDICQKALSPNHPLSATAYSNMGIVYYNMGEHAKGLSYCEKALEIQERTLPKTHSSLTASYSNLSLMYSEMGEHTKALSFDEKTAEIFEKMLPPNYSSLAASYSNLGSTYINMKEYIKALSFYEKALEIREKLVPHNHSLLQTSYNHMGLVYVNMAEYSKALSFYEKELEVGEKTLPYNHPSLATSYNKIGSVYYMMGYYSKSLPFLERALGIWQCLPLPNQPNLRQIREAIEMVKTKL